MFLQQSLARAIAHALDLRVHMPLDIYSVSYDMYPAHARVRRAAPSHSCAA